MVKSGFVVAAPRSGEGKTTITCGLMQALIKRGLVVQPFKIGPDYVDPIIHQSICRLPSINLDSWFVEPPLLINTFQDNILAADVAILEGVMGLFDGGQDLKRSGSTAEVAKLLNLNVIFVVDGARIAKSVVPLVKGFADFDLQVKIAAVILNNVGSSSHLRLLKEALEDSTGIPVLGGIPKNEKLILPEKRFGLALENKEDFLHWAKENAKIIEENLDLNILLELTSSKQGILRKQENNDKKPFLIKPCLALARDESFNAYYQENLSLLTKLGVDIKEFSPLYDKEIPAGTNGIYISGQFQEKYAERLAKNESMLDSIKKTYDLGKPILAEGAGLAYLTEGLRSKENFYPFLSIVPTEFSLSKNLSAMGYRRAILNQDTILGPKDTEIRGHEFHYNMLNKELGNGALDVYSSGNRYLGQMGYVTDNLLASFIHWHFMSNPQVGENFYRRIYRQKELEG